MRKVIFAVFLFCALGAFAKSKNPAKTPVWFEHKEISYPPEIFVSAIGEGKTKAQARENAVSQISLFFNTTSKICNDLIKEYNEIENGKNYSSTEKTKISEKAQIRSSAEFFGVQFSDFFSDKSKTYVCAFLNREDAFKVYDGEIKQNVSAVSALLNSAQSGSNPVRCAKSAERAVKIATLTQALVKNARILKSVPDSHFENAQNLFFHSQSVLDKCREKLVFSVSVENDWNGTIAACISRILENEGYAVSKKDSENSLRAVVSAQEAENAAGFFLYCSLQIEASQGEENPYFSYSRNFGKKGSRQKNDAYRLAYKMIAKEIEDSFASEFNSSQEE